MQIGRYGSGPSGGPAATRTARLRALEAVARALFLCVLCWIVPFFYVFAILSPPRCECVRAKSIAASVGVFPHGLSEPRFRADGWEMWYHRSRGLLIRSVQCAYDIKNEREQTEKKNILHALSSRGMWVVTYSYRPSEIHTPSLTHSRPPPHLSSRRLKSPGAGS